MNQPNAALVKDSKKTGLATTNSEGPAMAAVPEGFIKVATEHHMYHPKWCDRAPIHGYLIDRVMLKDKTEAKDGKPGMEALWVYVFKLLSPGFASKEEENAKQNEDGETIQTKYVVLAGEILYVTAVYELNEALKNSFQDPDVVLNVFAQPIKKVGLKTDIPGQKMWKWSVNVHPTKAKRAQIAPTTVGKMIQAARTPQILMLPPKSSTAPVDGPDFVNPDDDGR